MLLIQLIHIITLFIISKAKSIDNCLYDLQCDPLLDIWTSRFYTRTLNDICDTYTYSQNITYTLSKDAKCKLLSGPSSSTVNCNKCKQGQFIKKNSDHSYRCEYCPVGTYMPDDQHYKDNCITCSQNVHNIFYYFPEHQGKAEKTFVIISDSGSIKIEYEQLNVKETCDYYMSIQEGEELQNFPWDNTYEKIVELTKGKYKLIIKGLNFNIKLITIINSSLGGGYTCDDTPIDEAQCSLVDNDVYYSSLAKSCIKCPIYTHMNDKGKCTPNDILVNNAYMNKIFYKSFISSLTSYPNMTISDYIINFEEGYIYNTQTLTYPGKELINVQIVRGEKNRGVLLTYIGENENNKSIQVKSKIYISCDKETTSSTIINEQLVFIIGNKNICPVCLSSELSYSDSECIDNKMNRTYSKNAANLCNIQNDIEGLVGLDDEDRTMFSSFSTEGQEFLSLFSQNENLPNEDDLVIGGFPPLNEVTYLSSLVQERQCKNEKEDDTTESSKLWWIILLLGLILIMASVVVYLLWQKKKLCFNTSGNTSNISDNTTELQSRNEMNVSSNEK